MFRVCDVYMDPDEMGERYKVVAIAPRRSVCRQVDQSGQDVVKDETERRATPLGRSMKSCIAVKIEEVDLSFKSNQATRQTAVEAWSNRGATQSVMMRIDFGDCGYVF